MATLWMLTGTLNGREQGASWDDQGGLLADAELLEEALALVERNAVVDATPTGPSWIARIDRPDIAWAVCRAALDDVTDQVGDPPGYPWGLGAGEQG